MAYHCQKCDRVFNRHSFYYAHQEENMCAPGRQFKCDICGKHFQHRHVMMRHRHEVHISVTIHVCDICDKSFHAANTLKRHIAKAHKSGRMPYICQFCNEKFNSRIKYRQHLSARHSNDMKCAFCDKKFASIVHFQKHVENHSTDEIEIDNM